MQKQNSRVKIPTRPKGERITEKQIIDYCFAHDGNTAARTLGISRGAFYQWIHIYKNEGDLSLKKKTQIIKSFGFIPVTQFYKSKGNE